MSVSDPPANQVPVDEPLVRRLLAAQFPRWAELPIERTRTWGTDNAMFRLGPDRVVRLPRFARWAPQVDREQRWLPWLAPQLPSTIPVPLGLGQPAEGYPFRWSVYPWLDGENPARGGGADPDRLAREVAEFIRALRRIDPTGGPEPQASNAYRGVPVGDSRPSLAADDPIRRRIAALAGLVDTDALTAVWEAALAAVPAWDGRGVWIHGDLAAGNLLTVGGRLRAVIDFGCLAVGDPACDLMAAWTLLPAGSRAVFRDALSVDDATWARGRGWGMALRIPAPEDFSAVDPDRAAYARRIVAEFVADHRRGPAVPRHRH
ncbi:aminoglycoside phosphotransferase family protein [Plantactinospora sp. WMMB782]|uniref:aminoglycoside phosphotransferase family protein n=1 Tax=Plantactinospora sp. WMMB782 TaxID=3404121 RepID=UPI003B940B4E